MIESDGRRDRVGELIRTAGKRPVPSEADARRVFGAAREAWLAKVRARRRRWVYAVAASTAFVTVLGAGIGAWLEPESPAASVVRTVGAVEARPSGSRAWRRLAPEDAAIAGGTQVRTATGGRAAFDLNGVSLRVDEATRLVLDSADRVSLEAGAVYLDSRSGVPGVEVATAFGTLRDVGTQFEVRTSTGALHVRVREGRVHLESRGLPEDIDSVAGEELTVSRDGDVRRRPFPAVHPDWAWAERLAASPELDGRSAYDALRWVARETGRRLVFADDIAELRARSAVLSGGRGELSLTPADVLQIVSGTVDGLDYRLENGVLSVRTR